ncbi:MarR family transcriptional regulator [Brevibacillus sp. WF146]|jgi:DNA-binding MarR family transcriptional regulator|uniref:MarR family winged helix-turn-helix transcriptional regulator n=1 Tax=Brevibacillus sp. WF146 TaxID=319501 RepID=UPI0007ECE71C|nr:MarR family transcriptional regulator [Brevibacillus sp. WF146]UYZ14604.1 MarR family transcriptional regulator [Brevibacillus sp. WF146]
MNPMRRMSMQLILMNKVYLDVIAQELTKCGLTVPQMFVLGPVMEAPRTIGELSRLIDLSYSTVSGIVDRLERDGFVKRVRDEKDRRMVWVELADTPQAIKQRIPFMQDSYFDELFDGMSDQDVEAVCRSLTILTHYLEKRQQSFPKKGGSCTR